MRYHGEIELSKLHRMDTEWGVGGSLWFEMWAPHNRVPPGIGAKIGNKAGLADYSAGDYMGAYH